MFNQLPASKKEFYYPPYDPQEDNPLEAKNQVPENQKFFKVDNMLILFLTTSTLALFTSSSILG